MTTVSKRIVLTFPHKMVDKPVVYKLVKDYDLMFNILQAKIMPNEEGIMVLELQGEKANYDKGIHFLKDSGVRVEPLSKEVTRDEDCCTQCGACVTVCPTEALYVDRKTMKVLFDPEKCIACELCIKACPPRAMKFKI